MPNMSLYNSCLRAISLLLIKRFWMSRRVNPFRFLPSEILHDLVTTTLRLQTEQSLRADSLELLLTSGNIRQLKLKSQALTKEIVLSFHSLTKACQNLEVLELIDLCYFSQTEGQRALEDLIRSSPNLKYIHSELEFDIRALRQCKKLKTVMLHFNPSQPWYEFLEEENGKLQSHYSLESFTICDQPFDLDLFYNEDLIIILQQCPSLISLGFLNSARALAQLHRKGILPQVKLRCCRFRNLCYMNQFDDRESGWVRDALNYHPFLEELYVIVHCIENIGNLGSFRNLVFLDVMFRTEEDLSVPFYNVLKDIGHQLKYLCLTSHDEKCPVDVYRPLQNCPNLKVLLLNISKMNTSKFVKSSFSFPNLKYLMTSGSYEEEKSLLSLFSDCNNLMKLETENFSDKTLDKFLRRNSLSNLKFASFKHCEMTNRGFKNFFLNAPELEIIKVPWELEREVNSAKLEANHKKVFFMNLERRQTYAFGFSENHFGIFDEFLFKKTGCYSSRFW